MRRTISRAVAAGVLAAAAMPADLVAQPGQGRGNAQQEARGDRGGTADRVRPPRAREGDEPRGRAQERGKGSDRGGETRPAPARARDEARPDRDRGSAGARDDARGRSGDARPSTNRGSARGRDDAPGRSGEAARGRDDDAVRAPIAGAAPRGPSVVRLRRGGDDRSAGTGNLAPRRVRQQVARLGPDLRRMASSDRASEWMTAGALVRAHARGAGDDDFRVRPRSGGLLLLNRRGEVLLDLDDRGADELGGWRMRLLGDRRPRGDAPAFCRSGEGHPVWGREWCLDKGFGLGSRGGTLWSRTRLEDLVYRRRTDARLDRVGLVSVLGDVAFGRLALQAVTLGYAEPLVGVWLAEPDGPRILHVRSGDRDVAEFVDLDRDDRVDVLYVVQPRW